MINPSILSKYLAGDATDEEVQLCEELLNERGSVEDLLSDLESKPTGDSLLETLKNLGNHKTRHGDEHVEPTSLVEQIQSLVAKPPIGQEDFDRILSPAEFSDEIGRIAHYRVIEFIASGGMGLVFKAEDSRLNRLVCIKVLHPSLATNRDSVMRFEREVQAAAKLRNTRITTVLEFGEHRELPYLVMELLEGQSLRDKLNVEETLSPATAKKLTIQIAEGLRYAHQRGYLHRDIKPENIWVTPEGDIKLLDFGLARALETNNNLTHSGMILGTPTYMSPEQVQGKELDPRSDLFSVGTVLFEMLAGESPFGKSNLFSTMMSVANDSLTFPETTASNAIPADLTLVIQSLLQKSPEDRFESADRLIAALNSGEDAPLVSKTGASKSRVNPLFSGLIGGVIGACCLAIAFLLYQLNDKGTLIVEADPSVKLSIANEKVSIEDPQTGKKYDVVVGKTPLPSGIYQLEMADTSGDYTLSSNVITIRRGEEQIVRVELKPSPSSIAKSNKVKDAVDPTSIQPSLTLAELPTLSADELKRKLNIQPGDALFRNAIVSEPKTRPGVTSWSIETALESAAPPRVNSNGSRIATQSRFADNKVGIWDRDSKLTHIIPAQDKVVKLAWSPQPDIIAIVEHGNRRKQVTVWKLFKDYVEAIDVIPSEGIDVAWSWDGSLLAVRSEQEVSFIDLSKGSVFAHPNFGISGKTSDHPWSQNGRYFAAAVDQDVKVWDLEERKLLHIFNGKQEAQFLPESNEIAIRDSEKWEVWNLETFIRTRTIEPEASWEKYFPDPKFKRLFIVTQEGSLILKELETGETANCELTLDAFHTKDKARILRFLKGAKIEWNHHGTDFALSTGTATFLSNKERKKGYGLDDLANLQGMKPFSRTLARIVSSHAIRNFDLSANTQRFTYYNQPFDPEIGDYSDLGTFNSFDLEGMKYFPPNGLSIVEDAANYKLSPDGQKLAIVGTNLPPENSVWSEQVLTEFRKIRIYLVETGKLINTLETGYVYEMLWSADSTSLIVSTINSVEHERKQSSWAERNAQQTLEKYDKDQDGQLSKEEAKPTKMKLVDKDGSGFFTKGEIATAFDVMRRRDEGGSVTFNELDTRIFDIANGNEILLEANVTSGDRSEKSKLCFQRGGKFKQVATPVLLGNQIVLPLFEESTFQNGERPVPSRQNPVTHNDLLGFFDIKTGKLNEAIKLNCEFAGQRLQVTEDLILTGVSSRQRSSSIDSFVVFDRQKENEGYLPIPDSSHSTLNPLQQRIDKAQQRSRLLQAGDPYLSPKHPLVAVSSKNKLSVWKFDSENQTFSRIKEIKIANRYNRGRAENVTWHAVKPIVAWIDNGIAYSYCEANGQLNSFDAVPVARGIASTPDGWLVVASGKMVLLDHDFKTLKTYLSTERFVNYESDGKFDQAIGSDGSISNPETDANLRVIQLRENRIETRSVEILTH